MAKPSRFWDRMAKRYAARPVPNEAVYQKKLAITRDYLTPDSTVLEFGCGTGSTAMAHAPYAAHILATDFSERMIGIARDKAAAAGLDNVTFAQRPADRFDADADTYDMVMGHSILHLLDDWQATIGDAFRVLKPGGAFITSTPCLASLWPLKLAAPLGRAVGLLPTLSFFSRDELRDAITGAGFEIEHEWLPDGSDAVFIVARKPGA